MKDQLTIRPIAYIESDFGEKFGVPRQSGRVKELVAAVRFEKDYALPEALRGIEEFSHLWLLWGFSLNEERAQGQWSPTVRPPRLGGNKRLGVFATRSPNRPNPVGLSLVELIGVRKDGGELCLIVGGADLVSGSPIYDIKPYLPKTDSAPDAAGGYADAHSAWKLEVDAPEELLEKLPEEKRAPLIAVLAEDPRPSYQHDRRPYGMNFAGFEIGFFVDEENVLHVTRVEKQI